MPKGLGEVMKQMRELDVAGNTLTELVMPKSLTSLSLAENPIFLPSQDPKSVLILIGDKEHASKMSHLDISSIRLDEVRVEGSWGWVEWG